MSTEEILSDITSRDTAKVWKSSCEIISIGQHRDQIFPLIAHLPEIKEQTKGLEMGGGFALNQRFIDYAIRILEFHQNHTACTCTLYTDSYECNDPNKEVAKGNLTIQDTKLENNWIDYYISTCNRCGQRFKTIEREGHYTWWQWIKLEVKNK